MKKKIVPVEISARHLHLSLKDLEKLFSKGYELQPIKQLSQAKMYAAKEVVDIKHGQRTIKKVRVVGPIRSKSQIELTKTEARYLKIKAPVRLSGNVVGAPKIEVVGPKGKAQAAVIIAQRHLHVSNKQAKELGLKNKQKISLHVKSKARSITFHELVVRAKDEYNLAAHIDTDEANAAGLDVCSIGELIIK